MEKYDIDKPEKFTVEKWIQWEGYVYNYFDEKSNSKFIPFICAIPKDDEYNNVEPTWD